MTRWATEAAEGKTWKSYPRPRLQRQEWQNLNGHWDYAITSAQATRDAIQYEGEILVPFAAESFLSGVQHRVNPDDLLWYRRSFELQPAFKGKDVLLHFGAVDYSCQVWINGRLAGSHVGGNNPFSFNITRFLHQHGPQLIEVCVKDPTDTGTCTRGKQVLGAGGIWYTAVTGIWKTVWLEPVNKEHVLSLQPNTSIADGKVRFDLESTCKPGTVIDWKIMDQDQVLIEKTLGIAGNALFQLPSYELWTPENPKLYQVSLKIRKGKKVLDEVRSYFAFREISKMTDAQGVSRIALNGKEIFQYGTLDQGWWPDGLLTPPSEEAMLWDMMQLKKMGFNTIRKHIKVEPELYYHYADSLGLMVWQDMVCGFQSAKAGEQNLNQIQAEDWNCPQAHKVQWQKELLEMMDDLKFYPSITTWVIFNEGWGQHNTVESVQLAAEADKTRLINAVSGWRDRECGDFFDIHNYPATAMKLPSETKGRISVLGEFGGYGLPVTQHIWNPEMANWGYKNIDGTTGLINDYSRMVYDLQTLKAQGLAAAIYTQTTDVEGEVNGLITYDREIIKMPVELMHRLHEGLYSTANARPFVFITDSRSGKHQVEELEIDGVASADKMLPQPMKGVRKVRSRCLFHASAEVSHLSLWLNMDGHVNVWINGHQVFSYEPRWTNQHNQFNISDYASYIKPGDNEFILELESNFPHPISFDYGLTGW